MVETNKLESFRHDVSSLQLCKKLVIQENLLRLKPIGCRLIRSYTYWSVFAQNYFIQFVETKKNAVLDSTFCYFSNLSPLYDPSLKQTARGKLESFYQEWAKQKKIKRFEEYFKFHEKVMPEGSHFPNTIIS